MQLSVNVSVRDLLDAGLAGRVEGELAALGLPPEVLLIEVSDRALTSEAIDIAAGVSALRGLGVRLSLDDFGTGYASLARLRRMPVAEVKIAPSFVSGLASSPDSQVIVRSLVDLVRGLGIRSVAEGVETADVAAALLAMGCDAAQGHAFSRPLNAAAATRWLAGDLAVAARRRPRAGSRPVRSPPRPLRPRSPRPPPRSRARRIMPSARPRGGPRMASMSIARAEVAHLARLSRLALGEEELDHFATQLDQIISAVARVQEVAADQIPPTTHAVPVTNVFRDDVELPCLGPGQALSQAPAVEQQRFRVPRILAED